MLVCLDHLQKLKLKKKTQLHKLGLEFTFIHLIFKYEYFSLVYYKKPPYTYLISQSPKIPVHPEQKF